MVKIQLHLSDELTARAENFCRVHQMSFDDLARLGIERLLDQSEAVVEADWRLPSPQPLGWCELGDEAMKAQARFPVGVESSGKLRGVVR
jgi:hypothetical protein